MSAYLFSQLSDDQVIDWDAQTDLLRFDSPSVSAASLQVGTSADGRDVVIQDGSGKKVTLAGTSLFQLSATHFNFADGSRLVLPTVDNAYSFNLVGGSGSDLLLGSGPVSALTAVATNSAGSATAAAGDVSASGDGRLVAFSSSASALVEGDTNATTDVFVKDLVTGLTTRVSTSSSDLESDGSSSDVVMSLNGQQVVFTSSASNLVFGDTNAVVDVFAKNLVTGALVRVSTSSSGVQADASASDASVSGDGRLVVFTSGASNLVTGDTNANTDVFLKDLHTGKTTLVSGNGTATGTSSNGTISSDGRFVAFDSSASNLVASDTNARNDVFVRNLVTGGITRVSTDASGVEANGSSSDASISANGRYVSFTSSASNLVAGDINGTSDVFVKDLQTGAVTLVSQRADGTQGSGFGGAISGDGRYVAFYDNSGNFNDDDRNFWYDLFVKDLVTGELRRLSIAPDGGVGISTSMTFDWKASFSADGSSITFMSPSRSLLPGDPTNSVTAYTVSNPLLGVTLAGGAGNDVYDIQRASDVIVEQAGQGTDTVRSSVSLALADNVENLSLTGVTSINATGNALANVLAGNAGDNVLDGLGGVDTASYATASEAVTVDLASADVQDTGGAGLDTLVNIENLVGSAYDDTLLGNDGANTIDGGAGADLMMGGLGNDTYVVNHEGDQVLEYAAEGTDTVRSNLSYILGTGLEDLVLLGTANKNGTGNGAANVLTGNRGNNVLDGGLGIDTASYATALSGVRVGLDRTGPQSTSGAGVDTLISIENLTGSAHADTLHGNAGTNVLNGGAGVDTLSYARAAAAVTVDLSLTTAQATGGAGLDTVLLFENLTGSAYADSLSAGAGNNLLDGGAGADTMTGGSGNDTYIVDNTLDTVVEVTYGGTDTVISSVTYKLSNTAAENLTLTGSDNINATGNALSNVLTGNAGANVLNGGGGSDTASYAGVATSVTVNLATGLATGGGGSDSLISIENVVTGSGADGISGSDAANVLNGGAGNDSLTGGLGADTFVFDNLTGADAVTDFISGSDVLRFHQGTLVIGNGDASVDGGVLRAAAGGFATSAELVIFSANIAGAITSSSAAAAIGSANSAYAFGDTALFVVDNGTDSALYRFRSGGADAFVSGSELTHVATLVGTNATALADYVFAA